MTLNLSGRLLIIAVAAAAIACAFSGWTSAVEGRNESEMQPVIRAVFADEQLWLLHDDGSLVSLAANQAEPQRVETTGKIAGICRSGNALLAVADNGNNLSLQQRSQDAWIVQASVPTEGDSLVAMDCSDSGVLLVTNRRVLELDGTTVRAVKLDQVLGGNAVALASGDAVWVGFNYGEWGGGLRRVDLDDGTVETVERKSGLCGGSLNTDCDPVTGIVEAPWDRSCVVAAIGLVHMMAHGRIVEVCGTDVRRLYFKPLDPQPSHGSLDDGEPSSTIAFFGLERVGSTVWAVGIDGIYRFDGRQAPQFQPLPKFEDYGGYRVSIEIPGIALAMTDVNRRLSLSGSVPLLALR